MLLTVVLFLIGLTLVVVGSDFLVDGASSLARRLHVSEFIIGLTIVGFGTSCPELVVSLNGALSGNPDVAIGNVVGSNVFNILLILGITGLIAPIAITKENLLRDIPLVFGVSVFFVLVCMDGSINLVDGVLMLIVFAFYLWYSSKSTASAEESTPSEDDSQSEQMSSARSVVLVIAGLAGLIFGGKLFVDNAVNIARVVGVSDKFIAITLLAGGTSLPELATCLVAAIKGKSQLALGNILGSCVFNLLLIVGAAAVVSPLNSQNMLWSDYAVMIASVVVLFASAYIGKKNTVDKADAAVMLVMEAVYFASLFVTMK